MTVAIMQPYFFPYVGYFQLISAVDEFIVYDNIEYTKKGWINRNRILVNGADAYVTLPLKKASDFLHVSERYLADTWGTERKKLLNRINESYRKAPYFKDVYPLLEKTILFEQLNLFEFIFNSISRVCQYLEIGTKIIVSSTLAVDPDLKNQSKVISICKNRNADRYINPIGGIELYNKQDFKLQGIDLGFLKSDGIEYRQFENDFVPWLSIIDIMMFNSKEETKNLLSCFKLI